MLRTRINERASGASIASLRQQQLPGARGRARFARRTPRTSATTWGQIACVSGRTRSQRLFVGCVGVPIHQYVLPLTYICWEHEARFGPISYILEIKGRTVTYTRIDHYADRGGTTEHTVGLNRGREYYRHLFKMFGHPAICRTDLPQDA